MGPRRLNKYVRESGHAAVMPVINDESTLAQPGCGTVGRTNFFDSVTYR